MTSDGSGPNIVMSDSERRTLGRYEILHRLASGGMATVFLGRILGIAGFARLVAIKCCREALRRDEQFVTMFLDEARLGAQINHPNVVSILDVGDDDELYLVMEYVEGPQLSELIRLERAAQRVIPLPITLRIMIDTLNGLQGAHETLDTRGAPLNIIHRDITPSNILVGSNGITRITDFGIAKAEMRATATMPGVLKGKLGYTAPEQLDPDASITQRVDIFSAGIVLWEMLTGRGLYRGKSEGETVRLIMEAAVSAPSLFAMDIPEGIDAAVLRALAKNPNDRFETALAFAEELEACGTKPATAREVAAYVNDLLSEKLTQQRSLVRGLVGADDATSATRNFATRVSSPDISVETRTVPAPPDTTGPSIRTAPSSVRSPDLAVSLPALSPPSPTRLRAAIGVLACLLVASVATIGWMWRRQSQSVSMQRAITATPSLAEETTKPAEPSTPPEPAASANVAVPTRVVDVDAGASSTFMQPTSVAATATTGDASVASEAVDERDDRHHRRRHHRRHSHTSPPR